MKKTIKQLQKETNYLFIANFLLLLFFTMVDLFTNIYLSPLVILFGTTSTWLVIIKSYYAIRQHLGEL